MNTQLLKIAEWNANGMSLHAHEIKTFIIDNNIDVLLVAETHFTNKNHLKIPKYNIYHTNHPDNTAHGGTAVIIRSSIKHYELVGYKKEYLQATSVALESITGTLILSAVYCPPKHNNKKEQYANYIRTLGNKFISGGDYNAKNTHWGSRLTNTKGRELMTTITDNNLNIKATGEPTYWPSDPAKIPDAIDFFIIKGINPNYLKIESNYDLSSDHSPIILTLYAKVAEKHQGPYLCNQYTNWELFRQKLDENIELNVALKTPQNIEDAIGNLTKEIQKAAWYATPNVITNKSKDDNPIIVKEKIIIKRRLRKKWQNHRTKINKRNYNRAASELKKLLQRIRNQNVQEHLEKLTPTEATDYSLWRATRKMKRPIQQIPPLRDNTGTWARSNNEKAKAFAEYLSNVFKPYNIEPNDEDNNEIQNFLNIPFQLDLPIKKFTPKEIQMVITKEINPKKAPGYDLISGKILQNLTKKTIMAITHIFNAILTYAHFPNQWKVAEIIMILKPGKDPKELNSYRPISLLPIVSKLFEKMLLHRLEPIIEEANLIPKHQFGFRGKHGTIEQTHRLVKQISNDLENKRYCSAAFLDISQAFDKVWHTGLLYKLKKNIPYQYYLIIKSYLTDRFSLVKQQDSRSELFKIESGVPQGSVLGPVLYLLFTADLPTTRLTTVATYADDTAIIASHINPQRASFNLQANLNETEKWLKKWKLKANETKSTHMTFTLRRESCPPVYINNKQLLEVDSTKYLGIHLDKRLTWRKHIFTKRKQLGLKLQQMYWILGRQSRLSLENKLLVYKAILKPIWTYGLQLWGSASNSNLEIIQRFQNKALRIIVNAPWYVPNAIIERDLKVPSIKEEISKCSKKYKERLSAHPNVLASDLLNTEGEVRRLKRFKPTDLSIRF